MKVLGYEAYSSARINCWGVWERQDHPPEILQEAWQKRP